MDAVQGLARRSGQNPAMVLALLTATVAQMLDLATFVRMIAVSGPLAEANPIVAHLIQEMGLPFVAVTKVAALSLVVAIVAVLWGHHDARRHPRLAGAVLGLAILAGVFGAWTNVSAIL